MRPLPLSRFLALGLVLPFTLQAFAQESFGGVPMVERAGAQLPGAPVAVMPTVDADAMMAEDEARIAQGIKGPYRFGFDHHVDLSLDNSGVWHTMPNGGRVWRLAIQCPGALSVNFEFHDYFLPEGAEVFVYNEFETLGAFTMASSGGQESMGVTPIPGETFTIEYIEPAAVSGQGRLMIGQVTHAYRDVFGLSKGFGDSGACNNNVKCPMGDPWRDQIRSVAIIVAGGGICTGQMVNNCAQDATPYFLTARHCLPSNQNVNNWVYRFNWESPICTPSQNGPTNQSVSGSQLLAQVANADAALIRFNNPVPVGYNVFYSGWDKSGTAPTNSIAIHHPSGDVKKISFDNNAAVTATFGGAQCWRILNWESGTTEPGSSGSGLWNQAGLLVGQLYGGQASCANNVNDYYGKLSVSYPSFQQWLGNCGNTLVGYPINVGIDDQTNSNGGPVLAPNPTDGLVTMAWDEPLNSSGVLLVRDATGRILEERNLPGGLDRLALDLRTYAPGLYLLETRQGGLSVTQRLVIER